MNEGRNLYGAIEAGGTKFVCAVGYSPREILKTEIIPTTGPDETLARVVRFFENAVDEYGPADAVGVATFGPVDIDSRSSTYGSILKTSKKGWSGANFVKALAPLNAPVCIDSDVNGAGLGEARAGAGKGLRTIAYVTVGTGIGAAVVRDDQPLVGFSHYELGHIRPPHERARDPYDGCCPFHGDCLEGLASGPAIMARWGKTLSDFSPDHEAVVLEVEYLSHLALTLIAGHMPERIIFGGGVMKTPGLIERLRLETEKLLGGYIDAAPLAGDLSDYIVPPALGDLAGVVGAAALAEHAFGEKRAEPRQDLDNENG